MACDIRSAHNIGSLFRSCDGFGAELYLIGICPRPNSDTDDRLPHIAKKAHAAIAKTALGAEELVKWRYFETIHEAVEHAKKDGYRIVALEQSESSKSLSELHANVPTAILLGKEVEGLDEENLSYCDDVYEITMYGKKESFNVAVSAGIALYQARL